MAGPDSTSRPRPLSPDWWVRDGDGRVVVAQRPNPALWVWALLLGLRVFGSIGDDVEERLRWAGAGALLVWSVDELVRGASPLRRLLGALVLGFQVATLFGWL